jgi:hypothetical protein
VYGRINKKLKTGMGREQIETFIYSAINETAEEYFRRQGKNIYITCTKNKIVVTVNSSTRRVITVDAIL